MSATAKIVKRRKGMTLRRREMVSGLLFISPWLIGVTFFFLINLIQAGRYSFNDIVIDRVYGGFSLYGVGLAHFRNIFLEHGTFNRQLFTSIGAMVISVPLIIFFSLLMAVILNREFMARGLVRAIFFLPVVMATAAIVSTMELIMGMMLGGITSIPPDMMREAQGFNAQAIAFMLVQFGMPMQIVQYIVQAIAMLHDTIRASGVQILIFLAALQAITPSMYEVAQIEGATGYETFWKITIPMVSPLILTNVVYTIVDSYQHSPVVEMARTMAFTNQNFGVASAMSITSSLLACLVLLIIGWTVSKFVFYYN
ncbi:MAG: sugar ABC transporter permease [Firmicutes bacterium]|nr:sugar ABC transporter permease [Bacillota bacterium]